MRGPWRDAVQTTAGGTTRSVCRGRCRSGLAHVLKLQVLHKLIRTGYHCMYVREWHGWLEETQEVTGSWHITSE